MEPASVQENYLLDLIKKDTALGRRPFRSKKFLHGDLAHRYGIYSPGVDRFILIDYRDVWTTLTTAKILSSKIPTMVFSIDSQVNLLKTKVEEPLLHSINPAVKARCVQSNVQSPVLRKLQGPFSIRKVGVPRDFESDQDLAKLVKLQGYALTVQKIAYAIRIASARYNPFDHRFFADVLGESVAKDFEIRGDHTAVEGGVQNAIFSCLYFSQTVEEFLPAIDAIWQQTQGTNEPYRTLFYKLLELPLPVMKTSYTLGEL